MRLRISGNSKPRILADRHTVGKAERIGKRQIVYGQGYYYQGWQTKSFRKVLIRRHENLFVWTTHPDFSGFALDGAFVLA